MIYLDTSALVKLVRHEPETEALADWLDARTESPWVSSALIEVELPRALRRVQPELVAQASGVLARISRYEIDDVVRAAAAAETTADLRSLDAIHLVTARDIFSPLIAFVAYEKRLLAIASASGLPVQSPG